jgi:hypothetical protein
MVTVKRATIRKTGHPSDNEHALPSLKPDTGLHTMQPLSFLYFLHSDNERRQEAGVHFKRASQTQRWHWIRFQARDSKGISQCSLSLSYSLLLFCVMKMKVA